MTPNRMKSIRRPVAAFAVISLFNYGALAHEGHDDAPPVAASETGSPRLEAHSDLFELVGIVEHGAMTLYLDRYADNAPVTNAKIEVESGKVKGYATPNPDGSYTFAAPMLAAPAPGSFTFTVTTGSDADLLAGDLVVAADAEHVHGSWSSLPRVGWIVAALIALATALGSGWALRRRHKHKGEL